MLSVLARQSPPPKHRSATFDLVKTEGRKSCAGDAQVARRLPTATAAKRHEGQIDSWALLRQLHLRACCLDRRVRPAISISIRDEDFGEWFLYTVNTDLTELLGEVTDVKIELARVHEA